ncbi:hypothetical protein FN846DRAFT_891385 [Sphaerosporella brunnea]|uniref:Uncharacterized protein n=1 Tax=Sphaerosporella brunnea TaxID=1250544 RepID=A0A5J5EUA5_9PEZI|nr:hypothetical protein FN846DRAFT_891385 [Sphaerosporella brunnea]
MPLLKEDPRLRRVLNEYANAVNKLKKLCAKLPAEQQPAQPERLRHQGNVLAIQRRTADILKLINKLEFKLINKLEAEQEFSESHHDVDPDEPDEQGLTLRDYARRGQFSHEEVDAILRVSAHSSTAAITLSRRLQKLKDVRADPLECKKALETFLVDFFVEQEDSVAAGAKAGRKE